MKAFIKISILAICLTLSTSLFLGCGGGGTGSDGAKKYSITVEQPDNGSISASAQSAREGEKITVTATPNEGYLLSKILLNGEAIELEGNGASFTMPASNVLLTAEFSEDVSSPIFENVPTLKAFEIEAVSVRTPARGFWKIAFGESALEITVWVKDAHLYPNADGIKAYFGLKGYDRAIGENNIMVQVLANGAIKTFKGENGEYVEASLSGISAGVRAWGESESKGVNGFKISLSVDYETLKVAYQRAKGNITMLASHTNKNTDDIDAKQTLLAGSYDINKPQTYPVLVDNNEYEENPLASATAQLGASNGMKMGAYWNTEKDYFADEANYENRAATLTGHDNADNNIFFYQTSNAKQMYAEATFKVTRVFSNEQYGKFGLMLFDGDDRSGFFGYVDAYIGDQATEVNNIVGTELGYNVAYGGWGAFNTIADTNGSFDLATKTVTLKMAYKNNKIYFYCGDNLVLAREYNAGVNIVLGIKSFGYGLEVTNYYATANASDEKLIAHTPESTARNISTLFVGDNYLAAWQGYKALEIEGGKANEAITNETVSSLQSKISALKDAYIPQRIVISAGMNDINGGSTVQTVLNRIKGLVGAYAEAFPEAQLYWVSAIPSPANGAKLAEMLALNELVKEYAQGGAINYIEATEAFLKEGKLRANMFAGDGVALNSEFGLALYGAKICEGLNVQRAQGVDFGDNSSGYAYTSGWVFEEDGAIAVSKGTGEQVIWYSSMQYSADLYVEAYIRSTQNTGADAYPKAGLALRNDSFTIFAYADLAGNPSESAFMNIVYRPNVSEKYEASGNWDWNNQGNGNYGASMIGGFVKIAIAKLDNVIYMLANDVIVATYEVPGVSAEDEFVVGALNFNRKMEIKDAYGMTDRIAIGEKIGVEVLPIVSLEDASLLGGGQSAHLPSNLTYSVSDYSKSVALNDELDYARLYLTKNGECVITVNGSEVEERVSVIRKGESFLYVYDLANYLQQGENKLQIITADKHTAFKAKLVYSANGSESVIATDSSWALVEDEITLSEKPTYYFLGSSVTYGSATNGISFVEEVQKTLGYNVKKEAVSGTTLVDNGASSYIARMKTLPTGTSVNRLIVQLSTNDVTQNIAFGELASGYDISSFNTSTVIGAIEYIIAYAKQTWGCEVIFYTNPKYNNNRYNSLVNELYKVQEKWGIGIVDFFNYAEMERLDSATLNSYKADDIHPNVQGYAWMGKVFSEYIQNSLEKDVIRKYLAK